MIGKKGFQKGHPLYYKNPKGVNLGENNKRWKGDDVGYLALHSWVRRRLGEPSFCFLENFTCRGRLEWANIDHKYKRDLNDFIPLCRVHHYKFDHQKNEDI